MPFSYPMCKIVKSNEDYPLQRYLGTLRKGATKMSGTVIVALVVSIIVVFFPVLLIWYLNIAGIYSMMKGRVKEAECSTERDCPEGYVCVNGVCIPSAEAMV